MQTHTPGTLTPAITWTQLVSGGGPWDQALVFCCSQPCVAWAAAGTYLWSARVHYPSDNGSRVTAGGVFGLLGCLVA